MSARWVVARWEFLRYFNWKQELIGILILMAIALVMAIGGGAIEYSKRSQSFDVVVYNPAGVDLQLPAGSRIRLRTTEASSLEWRREQVGKGQLDGLLEIDSPDQARLLLHKNPSWKAELQKALDEARQRSLMQAAGLDPDLHEDWSKSVSLELDYHQGGQTPATRTERLAVVAYLMALLAAVMTAFAYVFTSITSEKQARVTEQIISAISTDDWIDGKILGLSALGAKSLLTMGLWGGLILWGLHMFFGSLFADMGGISGDKILVFSVFLLLGLLFWTAFLAGIAATIDDPNHSSRSSVMLIPTLPGTLMFFTLDHADHTAVVLMSWFPLSSMAAMPVRYALSEVPTWEVIGSAVLLAACALLMRRYAARVFQAGMMLYGKEPSWREIWRWMRHQGER